MVTIVGRKDMIQKELSQVFPDSGHVPLLDFGVSYRGVYFHSLLSGVYVFLVFCIFVT